MQKEKGVASRKKKITENIEQRIKFDQNFQKRKERIEKRHQKSIMNQLYIFPRLYGKMDTSTQLSSESEEEIVSPYNLKSQNQVSRKNQTQTQIPETNNFNHNKSRNMSKAFNKSRRSGIKNLSNALDEYHSTKSVKSVTSVESVGKTMKSKKSKKKTKNIEISFDTKKKSPKKRKITSQSKLLIEQYSLDNRAYQSLKRSSKGLLISYRPRKDHEISLSLSSKKVKTQY